MRKYAYLNKPYKKDNVIINKIMFYETSEGIYLYMYSDLDSNESISDYLYENIEDLYEDFNHLIDERGWIQIDDPLPYCQHDSFSPIRVKGRNIGKPIWGEYEILIDGKWVDYKKE